MSPVVRIEDEATQGVEIGFPEEGRKLQRRGRADSLYGKAQIGIYEAVSVLSSLSTDKVPAADKVNRSGAGGVSQTEAEPRGQ